MIADTPSPCAGPEQDDIRKGIALLRTTAANRRAAASPMADAIDRYASAIEAELAALQQDRDRLTWLGETGSSLEMTLLPSGDDAETSETWERRWQCFDSRGYPQPPNGDQCNNPRAAIDAARSPGDQPDV